MKIAKFSEHNAREAIKFNPRVLDLNSRVEDENGIKSVKKIKKILELIKVKFCLRWMQIYAFTT